MHRWHREKKCHGEKSENADEIPCADYAGHSRDISHAEDKDKILHGDHETQSCYNEKTENGRDVPPRNHVEKLCDRPCDEENADNACRITESSAGISAPLKIKSAAGKALLHSKWGSLLLQANRNAQALENFEKADAFVPNIPTTLFGMGVAKAALKRYVDAEADFRRLLDLRPKHVAGMSNLASVLFVSRHFDEALELCDRALTLPEGIRCPQVVMTKSNILRAIGKLDDAMAFVWSFINAKPFKIVVPPKTPSAHGIVRHDASAIPHASLSNDCYNASQREKDGKLRESNSTTRGIPSASIHDVTRAEVSAERADGIVDVDAATCAVVCVKWGALYSLDDVATLFRGVATHLTRRGVTFICFTDDVSGTVMEGVEMQALPEGFTKWWGKAFLFKSERLHNFATVVYLDLDQIIIGPVDVLFELNCPFTTLSTESFWCELSKNGYNSSVIVWQPTTAFAPIFDALANPDFRQYIHRFDHFLEMVLPTFDSLQVLCGPHFVVDWAFLCGATEEHTFSDGMFRTRDGMPHTSFTPPQNTGESISIVTFPRTPPTQIAHPWVKERWRATRVSHNLKVCFDKKVAATTESTA